MMMEAFSKVEGKQPPNRPKLLLGYMKHTVEYFNADEKGI